MPTGSSMAHMTYTWQFQQTVCNLGCLQVNVGGPDYTAPITSTGVTYYTFPTSGTYAVQLTATDLQTGTKRWTTSASRWPMCHRRWRSTRTARPPSATHGRCRSGPPLSLAGTITHAGTQDIENVYVDWGDGSGVDSGVLRSGRLPWSRECSPGVVPSRVRSTACKRPEPSR